MQPHRSITALGRLEKKIMHNKEDIKLEFLILVVRF